MTALFCDVLISKKEMIKMYEFFYTALKNY